MYRTITCISIVMTQNGLIYLPNMEARALGHSILNSSPASLSWANFLSTPSAPMDRRGSNHNVNILKIRYKLYISFLFSSLFTNYTFCTDPEFVIHFNFIFFPF